MEVGVSLGGFIHQPRTGARGRGMQRSGPALHNDNDASQRKASVRCPRSVLVSFLFCSVYSIILYSLYFVRSFRPSVAEQTGKEDRTRPSRPSEPVQSGKISEGEGSQPQATSKRAGEWWGSNNSNRAAAVVTAALSPASLTRALVLLCSAVAPPGRAVG